MIRISQLIFVYFSTFLWPREVIAQSADPADIDPSFVLDAGVAAGTIEVTTDALREVDKEGEHIGFELSGQWHISSAYMGLGLGYLYARAAGSDATTSDQQEAQLNTLIYDMNLGYTFSPVISTSVGIQIWSSSGSNFASKSAAAKNVDYWYGEFVLDPGLDESISFFLRYGRNIDAQDRRVTVASLGAMFRVFAN